jgi:hypothetical protein
MEEVARVPQVVKAPCLLNMVLKGKTPHVNMKDAESMGYRITILPGMLISSIVGLCDKMLAEVKETGELSQPFSQSGPGGVFARFDAAAWDDRRTAFRETSSAGKKTAAE